MRGNCRRRLVLAVGWTCSVARSDNHRVVHGGDALADVVGVLLGLSIGGIAQFVKAAKAPGSRWKKWRAAAGLRDSGPVTLKDPGVWLRRPDRPGQRDWRRGQLLIDSWAVLWQPNGVFGAAPVDLTRADLVRSRPFDLRTDWLLATQQVLVMRVGDDELELSGPPPAIADLLSRLGAADEPGHPAASPSADGSQRPENGLTTQ